MLTKTKNIRKKFKKNFFQELKRHLGIWPSGRHNKILKEIHAITSEIIDTIDNRCMYDGQISIL